MGANINAKLHLSIELITFSGLNSILTPKASRASAPPNLLLTLLFPCLDILAPPALAIIDATVLTLNVLNVAPPVPQVSIR